MHNKGLDLKITCCKEVLFRNGEMKWREYRNLWLALDYLLVPIGQSCGTNVTELVDVEALCSLCLSPLSSAGICTLYH
jgi:hypothetical protein